MSRERIVLAVVVMLCVGLCGPSESRAQGVIYVDMDASGANNGSSWPDAYNDLQDALAEASTNGAVDEVRVAQGTYRPDCMPAPCVGTNGDREATFQLLDGVELKGGYAGFGEPDPDLWDIDSNATILSGDLDGDDGPNSANNDENSYHVVTGSNCDATAILAGFTVTAGNADGSDHGVSDTGGGMYNQDGNPTLRNCRFSGNSADFEGGGMFNNSSSPTVVNCAFIGNSADFGGGMHNVFGGSSPSLVNCVFGGNSASSGGGIYNSIGGVNPTLTNCTFSGNSAYGTGQFSGGGGLHVYKGSPTLTNCTFSNNTATRAGGGVILIFDSAPTLTNCIFWTNADSGGTDESAQIHLNDGGPTPVITYSCIQGLTGGFGGTGNIGDDPLCVDADGPDDIPGTEDDNLRLLPGSPCIDAGDNLAFLNVAVALGGFGGDLEGNGRFVNDRTTVNTGSGLGAITDMGACEFGGIAGDFDQDGDVDLADFAKFQAVFNVSGP